MTTPLTFRPEDVNWSRSSFCGTGDCVEVARVGDVIRVRDGKSGDESPTIDYTPDQWALFLARIVEEGMPREAFLRIDDGGVDLVHSEPDGSTVLVFDREEWDAFVEGVEHGDFDLPKLSAPAPAIADAVGAVTGHPGSDTAPVAEEDAPPASSSATLTVAPNGCGLVSSSPAGQQSADTSSGCADADRPGPEPVHGALVQLCRPDWTPTLGDPTHGVEDWAHEWATDSFAAGMALAEKLAEARAAMIVNEANEWAKAIAPLVEHVPTQADPAPGSGREPAVVTAAAGSGEVAPEAAGTPPGATEPLDLPEWERELLDRQWREQELGSAATEPADECDGADR